VLVTPLWEVITEQRVSLTPLAEASRGNEVSLAPLAEGITWQRGVAGAPCGRHHVATVGAGAPCGRHHGPTGWWWRPFGKASRGNAVVPKSLSGSLTWPRVSLTLLGEGIAKRLGGGGAPSGRHHEATAWLSSRFRLACSRHRLPPDAMPEASSRLRVPPPRLRHGDPGQRRCARAPSGKPPQAARCLPDTCPLPSDRHALLACTFPMAITSYPVARDPLPAGLDRPRVAFRTHGPCARESRELDELLACRYCLADSRLSQKSHSSRLRCAPTSGCRSSTRCWSVAVM
jgi:hypothetical protein